MDRREAQEALMGGKKEPVPEPEVGDGWEFCEKDEAEEACNINIALSGWCAWEDVPYWDLASPPERYRYRRRKQPEQKRECATCKHLEEHGRC